MMWHASSRCILHSVTATPNLQTLTDALYELYPTARIVGLTTLRSHQMAANADDGHDF